MSDPDELISVYKAANATEAHLIRNLLLEEGVNATVAEEHDPFSLPFSPPEVLVRSVDETRARALIQSFDEEQIRRADRPDWKCPACEATVLGALDECEACGAARPGTETDED